MNYLYLFFYWFSFIMIIFFYLKHPLIMGLMLIFNTFILSVFISLLSFSSWNSYILFLMFLGGILILFLYNISLISSEVFYFLLKKKYIMLTVIILYIFLLFYFKQGFSNDMKMFFLYKKISPTMYFFSYYNFMSIPMLLSYLFLSLICIVNLVYFLKDKGSMRK